jgi:hypothetical protein
MRLAAYLAHKNLRHGAFGRLFTPPLPRSTVRQWALGERFPSDPLDLRRIEDMTGGVVTSADFVAHAVELRSRPKRAKRRAA